MDELSLDPADWNRIRALGHRMVDDMMTCLENIRIQPYSLPTQEAINNILTPLTQEGEGLRNLLEAYTSVLTRKC